MEDESRIGGFMKWGLGALGLGAVAAIFTVPEYGIWIAVAIVVLAVLLFGGYFLWWRLRARRRREQFSAAIEAQTSAAPKSISDPNSRARLDQLRQKFQKGLHEFKSRGKDLYKLPWYVIIGEPGSGKTEALRHSGIEFPPGLQDELQGSGGTVNMDWWFTNRAIILDTAGSMIFNESRAAEAPEWREFLRLLSKARPQCPINGLLLVLSVESLIRDSADTISQKASRLAQQLDLIQRTLDVRFPVYLIVTKCDLLTGFRDFFDGIEDPLLQHQIFGWSNPAPLDDHFRPDMVEQHLQSITQRLRRRRMALLRDTSPGGRLGDTSFFTSSYQLGRAPTVSRRTDEVDALFALPESLMRLAPRLRRYLETIFVAGEWSAKPVFLRGIYFTTSMREGKALDEAIALATGIPLDQLPEDRTYDKSRAFFLRDLFHDKIFRESGLVTRATNTLQLLRKRQLTIFGSASAALLLLLGFAWYGNTTLKKSVGDEAKYWRAGTTNWEQGIWWNGSIVRLGSNDPLHFSYSGGNLVQGTSLSVVDYHRQLRNAVTKNLSGGLIFKPIRMTGGVDEDRRKAQRILFEAGVIKPLVRGTQDKQKIVPLADGLARHKEAWLSLVRLERDAIAPQTVDSFAGPLAEKHLNRFLSYLIESDDSRIDTNIVSVFLTLYSGRNQWPPKPLLSGSVSTNNALSRGLENYHIGSAQTQTNITAELSLLNRVTDDLIEYQRSESDWLRNNNNLCPGRTETLLPRKTNADASWSKLRSATNFLAWPLTNLGSAYSRLRIAKEEASSGALSRQVDLIASTIFGQNSGPIADIQFRVKKLAAEAGADVLSNYNLRAASIASLDTNSISTNDIAGYQSRWDLYTKACALAEAAVRADVSVIGSKWSRFKNFRQMGDQFRTSLGGYTGPWANVASNKCSLIAAGAVRQMREEFVSGYLDVAKERLLLANISQWNMTAVTNARTLFEGVEDDLRATNELADQAAILAGLPSYVAKSKDDVLKRIGKWLCNRAVFPIVLSADTTNALSASDVREIRALLDGLQNELQNPVWRSASSISSLEKSCSQYAQRLNILTKEDGKPAEWELLALTAKGTTNWPIATVYRYVEVSMADQKKSPDLTAIPSGSLSLLTGPVDKGLSVCFRKSQQGAAEYPNQLLNWGLVRLIRQNDSGRLDDGSGWTIRIKLEDSDTKTVGDAVFLARPVSLKQPLPKLEEWKTACP